MKLHILLDSGGFVAIVGPRYVKNPGNSWLLAYFNGCRPDGNYPQPNEC